MLLFMGICLSRFCVDNSDVVLKIGLFVCVFVFVVVSRIVCFVLWVG